MAAAYHMLGDLESAHGLLNEHLAGRHVAFDPQSYLHLLLASMNVQWMAADLRNLVHTATHALAFGQERALSPSLGAVHHFLGAVHYQWNELDRAETHFAAAFEQRYAPNGLYAAHSGFGLALTHLAQGRPTEACRVNDQVVEHLLDRRNRSLLPVARAMEAELALRQGDLAAASQWAARPAGSPLPAMAAVYAPSFSVVRALLAQDTLAARQEAASLVSRLQDLFGATHNVRFRIEALALQALVHEALGNSRAALGTLEWALSLARPAGVIRLFVDQGPGMAELLQRLAPERARQEHVDHILSALADAHSGSPAGRPPSLSEPLTGRELEVLVLLAEHLSNKEIAARLVISAETVKMHASNIYRKLGVEGRGQAVARATALGLLGR
jgi:LuxR family maltose regulon positive regulatory protein